MCLFAETVLSETSCVGVLMHRLAFWTVDWGFEPPWRQKIWFESSRFLPHLGPLVNSAIMSNTDRTLLVGRWDGEEEEWPPAFICRG